MSGRDERPIISLVCPECAKRGVTNRGWALFISENVSSNSCHYNLKIGCIVKPFLHHHVGSNIIRIKCYYGIERKRHTFRNCDSIYWDVVKAVGFDDGVVK